jgi:chromosomal replication initiation ATPase DnaA
MSVQQTVLSLWKGPLPRVRTMARILAEVSEETGISVAAMKGPSRYRIIVYPRQEAIWRMVQEDRWTWAQIARFFNRDHTTIIFAFRQVEKRNALERAA